MVILIAIVLIIAVIYIVAKTSTKVLEETKAEVTKMSASCR